MQRICKKCHLLIWIVFYKGAVNGFFFEARVYIFYF